MRLRWVGWFFLALLVLVVLALAAPLVKANRFQGLLQDSLEKTLQRKVEIGDVRYRLFPLAGFTAENVVVHEDPQFALEPVLYADDLQAGLDWLALLQGRLQLAEIRFVDASLNLGRNESGQWNLTRLLDGVGLKVSGTRRDHPPTLRLRNSRINFRVGTLKNPVYLNTVDLDMEGTRQGLEWRYEASPARTDRSEQGFGRLSGRGSYTHAAGSDDMLQLDLELERSATTEVLMLLTGRDLGLQGRLRSKAFLTGPLNKVKITGSVQLEEVRDSSFLSLRSGRFSLPYEGVLDLQSQTVTIETVQRKEQPLPVAARFHASELLSIPHWEVRLQVNDVPAPTLMEFGHRLGARFPAAVTLEGKLRGEVEYRQDTNFQGELEFLGGSIRLQDSEPLALGNSRIRMEGGTVTLLPAAASSPEGRPLEISGFWSPAPEMPSRLRIASGAIPVNDLKAALAQLPGVPPPALLADFRQGALQGALDYESKPDGGVWSGDVELTNAQWTVEGLSVPVRIRKGKMQFAGGQWSLRNAVLEADGMTLTGEVQHSPGAERPHHARLSAESLDAGRLETLLSPVFQRRQSFLSRTLRFRQSPPPAWIRTFRGDAVLRAAKLKAGNAEFSNVRTTAYWDGAHVELPSLRGTWNDTPVNGSLSINLGQDVPQYVLRASVDAAPFQGGTLDGEWEARTEGNGSALINGLEVQGDFTIHKLTFPEEEIRQMNGSFDLRMERGSARVRLRSVGAYTANGESLSGQGSVSADGRLVLDLTSPRRTARFSKDLSAPGLQ